MSCDTINIDAESVKNQIGQIQILIAEFEIKHPSIEIKGNSDAMQKLTELYGRFASAVQIYNAKVQEDLEKSLLAVTDFQKLDADQAEYY